MVLQVVALKRCEGTVGLCAGCDFFGGRLRDAVWGGFCGSCVFSLPSERSQSGRDAMRPYSNA